MSFFVGGTPGTKGIRMKLRIFGFSTLIPSMALAGHFGGDIVFPNSDSRATWNVDGASVRFFDPESLCLCEGRTQWNLRLLPTDSVKVQNPKPADTTSVFTIQRPNPSSSNYVEHKLWFHDSLWWKVRGRTGWWAMESELLAYKWKNYYTDSLAYRFHWSRIDPNRPFVQWIDSVQNERKESGIVDAQKAHLLRCLADTGCTVDTLYGTFADDRNGVNRWYQGPERFGMGIQTALGWDTLWLERSKDGSITRTGRSRRFRTTNSASLAVQPLFSWSGTFRYSSFPGGWKRVRATWHFRVSGVADSIVHFGWIPQVVESIGKGNPHPAPVLSSHATDIHGNAVRLYDPRPAGIHFVHQNGRWTAVIFAP
jgi:hypothetical protein